MEAAAAGHVVLRRDRFRVSMFDTDAARLIHFAAPALWADRLLSTWLADAGAPLSRSLDAGYGDPMVHAEMTYRGPLRLDDEVSATLSVAQRTERSMTFHCAFGLGEDVAPEVEVWLTKVHVHFGPDGAQAVPIAGRLLDALDTAAEGVPSTLPTNV